MKRKIRIFILPLIALWGAWGSSWAENMAITEREKDADTRISINQQRDILVTGVVNDTYGEPMVGVNVIVKGTTIGTMTSADGSFSVKIPSEKTVLVFSFIGYKTMEIPYAGKDKITVVLEDNAEMLDEVQIIAYGTQKKVTVTGAISSINTDELLKSPTSSIGNMLAGSVSGISTVLRTAPHQ